MPLNSGLPESLSYCEYNVSMQRVRTFEKSALSGWCCRGAATQCKHLHLERYIPKHNAAFAARRPLQRERERERERARDQCHNDPQKNTAIAMRLFDNTLHDDPKPQENS
jgi:hypothetical protein